MNSLTPDSPDTAIVRTSPSAGIKAIHAAPESCNSPPASIQTGSSQKVSRLLTLPTEVRFKIYAVLLELFRSKESDNPFTPWASLEAKMVRAENLQTKKNLRLVCRRISQEWEPAFFKGTIICAHLPYSPSDPRFAKYSVYAFHASDRSSICDFDSFLKEVNTRNMLKHIRRIEFCQRPRPLGTGFDEFGDILGFITAIQAQAKALEALEQVTVSRRVHRFSQTGGSSKDWWRRADATDIKRDPSLRCVQTYVQDTFLAQWSVARRLRYQKDDILMPEGRISVDELQLIYHKSSPAVHPPGLTGENWIELSD